MQNCCWGEKQNVSFPNVWFIRLKTCLTAFKSIRSLQESTIFAGGRQQKCFNSLQVHKKFTRIDHFRIESNPVRPFSPVADSKSRIFWSTQNAHFALISIKSWCEMMNNFYIVILKRPKDRNDKTICSAWTKNSLTIIAKYSVDNFRKSNGWVMQARLMKIKSKCDFWVIFTERCIISKLYTGLFLILLKLIDHDAAFYTYHVACRTLHEISYM